jgi:ABC-2 type transport system ATP-binding protein
MITLKELTFWYSKQNRIFDNLNLKLDHGHIYGLLGKNGAGKTTLLKLLSGLSFPKTGRIDLDNWTPAKREPDFLSEIFLVPEEVSLPSLTARKFNSVYRGFYHRYDTSQFFTCLEKFEINTEQNLSKMSHGQKKKTMIAFAFATNTNYLFLDEPSNGLDIPSKAVLRSLLASVFSEERTIILSTHMIRDVENLIDSVIVLENRKIILNQSLDKVAQKFTFGHPIISQPESSIIYSGNGELGQAFISENHSGIAGNVDLETLFNACINVPEKVLSTFEN